MNNQFLFILRSSFEDFKRNKLRTLLTTLGILIGISSVVLLMAFGLGLKRYIEMQFEALGSNLIMVMPGKTFAEGKMRAGPGALGSGIFDQKDVISLKKIKNISVIASVYSKYAKVKGDKDSKAYEMIASNEDIFTLMNLEVETGKMFTKTDDEKRSKVVVLGSKPAEILFGSKESALGKTAKVDDQGFKVIGILKSKGGGFGGPSIDDHVFIPYGASLTFNPSKKSYGIYIKAYDEDKINETKEEIKTVLLKRYNNDDFSVLDQKELLSSISSIFGIMNIVLVGIAAISLLVGGIGVMNIMYVSVVERTKEIGIRRAVGATDHDILLQFMAESVILSIVGGILGLLFSYLVVLAIQSYFPAYIDLNSVLLALGVSSTIGIIFGVFPAKRASNLSPIDAIRDE